MDNNTDFYSMNDDQLQTMLEELKQAMEASGVCVQANGQLMPHRKNKNCTAKCPFFVNKRKCGAEFRNATIVLSSMLKKFMDIEYVEADEKSNNAPEGFEDNIIPINKE